jgi:dTDP-4-dehydrorhamnose reductase
MKIAVTGGTGLLGSKVITYLGNKFTFIPLSSNSLNIVSKQSVEKTLKSFDFDILLHLAAYTDVDKAETERETATMINVTGTKNVYDMVQNLGKKMIYISTDFVFDGKMPPYDELSIPNPIGHYATTKFEGEQIVKDNAMIVRISYPYQKLEDTQPKADFVHKLANFLKERKKLSMIYDSAITPTFIDDIAEGLSFLFQNFNTQTYHLVGSKSYTPYEIGFMIAKKLNIDNPEINRVSFKEFTSSKPIRPKYSIILSQKNNFQAMRSLEQVL